MERLRVQREALAGGRGLAAVAKHLVVSKDIKVLTKLATLRPAVYGLAAAVALGAAAFGARAMRLVV